MSNSSKSQANPSKPSSSNPLSSTVWIGNISSKATEYQVLRLAESIGKVVKFDFMYHDSQSGTLPRGYAFVTYSGKVGVDLQLRQNAESSSTTHFSYLTYENYPFPDYSLAISAMRNLKGEVLHGRQISVQPATSNHYPRKSDLRFSKTSTKESLQGLSMKGGGLTTGPSSQTSKQDKIRAIEAKLKSLEKGEVTMV